MGAYIPYKFLTHTRKVQRLYKAILRDIEAWTQERYKARIHMRLMRQKFEENRNIKDPILADKILRDAQEQFDYIKNPEQIYYTDSKGGVAYERKIAFHTPDHVLDTWHPLEKARYPDYFARREQRKKEYVEWYDKTYGKPAFENIE